MTQDVYTEYAILGEKIKELTLLKDSIKDKILGDMEKNGEEKKSTAVGSFTIAKLKTWTYSKRVKELEDEYNAQKAHEQSVGEATFVEKPSLRFTQINP